MTVTIGSRSRHALNYTYFADEPVFGKARGNVGLARQRDSDDLREELKSAEFRGTLQVSRHSMHLAWAVLMCLMSCPYGYESAQTKYILPRSEPDTTSFSTSKASICSIVSVLLLRGTCRTSAERYALSHFVYRILLFSSVFVARWRIAEKAL